MTQLAPTFGKTVDDVDALAACLGVEPAAIRGVGKPPQEVSCGSMFLFVPMTTRQAVDGVVVDRRATYFGTTLKKDSLVTGVGAMIASIPFC